MFNSTSKVFSGIAKGFGILITLTTMFGVAFQKGMLEAMGMGNINGNYDLVEIFTFAIFEYIRFFDKFFTISGYTIFWDNWHVFAAILFVIICAPFTYKQKYNLNKKKRFVKIFINRIFRKFSEYKFVSLVLRLISGVAVNILLFFLTGAIILLSIVIIFPVLIGFLAGNSYIDSKKHSRPPCLSIKETAQSSIFIDQCSQISFNGKIIKGEILLESREGYFLRTNTSFLYFNKDGTICISSKFVKRSDVSEIGINEFKFPVDETDSFCESFTS